LASRTCFTKVQDAVSGCAGVVGVHVLHCVNTNVVRCDDRKTRVFTTTSWLVVSSFMTIISASMS
jgi:hypothetical protein